jgi:hypothetical protein
MAAAVGDRCAVAADPIFWGGAPWRWFSLAMRAVPLTDELDRSYQLGASGAVLVRPDGYVAWHCEAMPADPVGALTGAIDRATGQTASTAALAG